MKTTMANINWVKPVYVNKEEKNELEEIIRLFDNNNNKNRADISKFDEPICKLFQLMHKTEIEKPDSSLGKFLRFYFINRILFYDWWEFCLDVKSHVIIKEE